MKAKISIFISTVFISILAASSAFAGESRGGYISHIATVDGAILFGITGSRQSDRPSCAGTGRFAARANSEHYQVIITAFEMGSKVTLGHVKGLGTCNLWHNSEYLRWIEINKQ
ncbi:MAG: hypothetical protein EBE86_021495 [Hormoscilla sp. GUM202]|nr:hypothetical protein [Hormoscilla sp. GUM202]